MLRADAIERPCTRASGRRRNRDVTGRSSLSVAARRRTTRDLFAERKTAPACSISCGLTPHEITGAAKNRQPAGCQLGRSDQG